MGVVFGFKTNVNLKCQPMQIRYSTGVLFGFKITETPRNSRVSHLNHSLCLLSMLGSQAGNVLLI